MKLGGAAPSTDMSSDPALGQTTIPAVDYERWSSKIAVQSRVMPIETLCDCPQLRKDAHPLRQTLGSDKLKTTEKMASALEFNAGQ
jgi:hypothetical protein